MSEMSTYFNIYELSHSNYKYSIYDTEKALGYFSSMNKAQEAIDFYIKKPGFKIFDRSNFTIKAYNLKKNTKNKYYIAYFIYHKNEIDDIILFKNLFETRRKANNTLNSFEKEFKDKFKYSKIIYETDFRDLDEKKWTSGFVTV